MKFEASPVSETTRQGASVLESCGQRKFTPAPIWTKAMLAALQTGVKGGKWHSLIDKVSRLDTLRLGWAQVERNAGAAGVDRMSVGRFAQAREFYLAELAGALRNGSYSPQPVRRVYIPKGKGRRPLGIPAVKDRVVQAALKLVIEPIFEHEFEPRSFGFRQGLGCKDALREVDRHLKAGYFWVVDADLQSYFDTIPHAALLEKVGNRIADGRVLELVKQFLKQDIMEDMTRWTPTAGSPQGALISPLLANIYLHELDVEMREAGLVMVRYADDAVVLCRSREEAQSALARMRAWVTGNGLTLHPEKTHLGDCRVDGQGFEFLGYRFEAGKRQVRKKSLMSLKDKIRAMTKRNSGHSIDYVIASLNPILRGWYGYFQHAHRYTFSTIDGLVRRRLRAMLRRQKHRPGQGRCLRDHKQWPNAYFADLGLFTMSEAHKLACQSRCGNN
ncbi:group II intron reverse transcriptase/maturase [Methylobacter sp.]|uniref:group II intron reverse transcriptase/maturase n=1 Tax=Methylobacter sp. TaxID=2051955 RepID=UPI003DA4AF4E